MALSATVISELVEQVVDLPTHSSTALAILDIIDDPDASAADLGRLIERDPGLSTRVMHLANSPYYGQSRQVTNAHRAVTVLGFGTVRSLAAIAAAGLFDRRGPEPPEWFWSHATATAAAASLVARRCGVPRMDAFSAGLLHDLGVALLLRLRPERYAAVLSRAHGSAAELRADELDAIGATHCQAAAAVLAAWQFPDSFVEAAADHHEDPTTTVCPLAAVVAAGEALAASVTGTAGFEPVPDEAEVSALLGRCGVDPDLRSELAAALRTEAEGLSAFAAIV